MPSCMHSQHSTVQSAIMSVPEINVVAEAEKSSEGTEDVVVLPTDNQPKKAEEKMTEVATMNTTSEDSEYETLEEDNGQSSRSSGSRRSSFSDEQNGLSDGRNDLSDGVAIEDEREDGDGEEENSQGKEKKLDDDEDRRNPQYIPKKGTFYEHDDRTVGDENEDANNGNETNRREEEGEKDTKSAGTKKGKVWTEKADRWTHDLYNEDEQKPKSTQELIDTYGYDIRNEEAPPKARRRRRYGRGPNKYTRNWEDEDAYNRAVPVQRRVFKNNKEEFPELEDSGSGGQRRRRLTPDGIKHPSPQNQGSPFQRDERDKERERFIERERFPKERKERNPVRGEREERPVEKERLKPVMHKEQLITPILPSQERHSSPNSNNFPPSSTVLNLHDRERIDRGLLETKETPKLGRGRGFRNSGKQRPSMEFTSSKGRGPTLPAFSKTETATPQVSDSLKHAADILAQDFSHIYINNNNPSNIVEETIIPRSERRSHHNSNADQLGGEIGLGGGRSKRYSTQRQRSLPETTPPPTYSPPHNIPYYTQPPPAAGYVAAPVYSEVTAPTVTSPPMQLPMSVAFLPPGPPPTATAAPPYPPPPLLNYMPPPTFQPLALQPPISGQFEDLSQSAELYQSQGGITYYSTQTQSVVPRSNPPRRVKLAIPIVPPPDSSSSNVKRSDSKQSELQSAAS